VFEEIAIFHRIVVLMDQLAPDQGAFAYALDWARRLRLPLAGIPVASAQSECAAACARAGVSWEMLRRNGQATFEIPQSFGGDDLLVLGRALPVAQRQATLRRTLRHGAPGTLFCPDQFVPLTRMLLLNQRNDPRDFLREGAELCRRLDIKLVVLTIAVSERQARHDEQLARETLTGLGLSCDFDFVAGSDVRAAVAGVARWRRCQLVVVNRDGEASWWRWLRSSTFERLIKLTERLAYLSFTPAAAADSAGGSISAGGASTENHVAAPASLQQPVAAGTIATYPAKAYSA
jgi:hypothetical protein